MDSNAPPVLAPAIPQDGRPSLIQVFLIFRRRWRLMAVVWFATLIGVGVYTLTTKRLYRPQATLEIRPEMSLVSSDASDSAFMASRINYENYYRTQEQILTSPTLIESVFRALPEAIRSSYKSHPDPVKVFSDRLDIEKVRTSFILKIGFVDEDREAATQIVNTVVTLYLEDANRRVRELKSGAAEVLSKEALPSIRARVDEADKALQAFQTETSYVDFEEHYRSLLDAHRKFDARFTDMKLQRVKLKAELEALSTYGADGVSGLFNPAFHATTTLQPLAQERARIASDLGKMEKLYKERHPAVQELREQLRMVEDKIREAIRGTLKALETDLAEVETEEKSLRTELRAVEDGMANSARRLTQFKRLDSELVSAKELYNAYLKKHGETTATSGTSLGSVRVVDHATVPVAPFKPRVLTNLALAAVVGLLLGAAAMFVTEQLDDRIQSSREVEVFVGLDVISVVPKLGDGKAESRPLLLGGKSSIAELETFRALRAGVLTRMEAGGGFKVLTLLSALQSEGKSTVTANLASVLAMDGRRVIVVDADLRRPTMLSLIGSPGGVGIGRVLNGEARIEDAIQKSRLAGVDVLGSYEGISSAAELGGSPQFEKIIQYAREHYDVVLIDSAPVNQVSESVLVARRSDAALLVIREQQTGRGAALRAIKRLRELGIPILGAVLNCSRPESGVYGYYYSYSPYTVGK